LKLSDLKWTTVQLECLQKIFSSNGKKTDKDDKSEVRKKNKHE